MRLMPVSRRALVAVAVLVAAVATGQVWAEAPSFYSRDLGASIPKFQQSFRPAGDLSGADVRLRPESNVLPRRSAEPRGFLNRRLIPGLSRQLHRVVPLHESSPVLTGSTEAVMLDRVTDAAERRTLKGLRKAFEHHLLETTSLGQRLTSVSVGRGGGGGGGRGKAVRFGVRVASGLPRMELRYRTARGQIRFSVDLDGATGFEIKRNGRAARARVFAGYDIGDDALDLAYRYRF
ncbi:MAG: hypothetical protein GY716_23610 [bacterium]|nr:hypothetical protein [bacterium]